MDNIDYSYNGISDPERRAFGAEIEDYIEEEQYEDEDYNLLNDETFGENIEDYEWEHDDANVDPFHAEVSYGGDYIHQATRAYSPNTSQEAELRLHEDEMAYNIRRLVVDDDNTHPLVNANTVTLASSIPIKRPIQDLDNLFGPSSPPALYDSHMIMPEMGNIWGSPAQQSPLHTSTLDELFTRARFANAKPSVESPLPPIKKSPYKAITVEELEQQMLSQPPTPSAVNVADLERKLLTESRSPTVARPQTSLNGSAPSPMTIHQRPVNSKFPPQAAVETDHAHSTPTSIHEVTSGQTNQLNPVRFPANFSGHRPQPYPSPAAPHLHPAVRLAMGNVTRPPLFFRPGPPNTNILPGQVFANMFRMPRFVEPPFPTTYNGTPLGPRGPPPRPLRMTYSDPTAVRGGPKAFGDHAQAFKYRYNNRSSRYRNYPANDKYQQAFDSQRHRPRDPYRGLMTQREKDWVIKIQLLQLQSDNPYIDDYYYTTYTLNKARQRQAESQQDDDKVSVDLLLPHMSKGESREYKPANFEGSLGCLTPSSVHNPRRVIDVHVKEEASVAVSDEHDPALVSQKLRRFRQLLTDIENGYSLLLSIDDTEKEILALPVDNREHLVTKRREKIAELYTLFIPSEYKQDQFTNLLSVRKGKSLLVRCLPLFSPEQVDELGATILLHISTLLRKDTTDDKSLLLRVLKPSINQSDRPTILRHMSMVKPHVSAMLLNKFGASVLIRLIRRMEQILVDGAIDDDDPEKISWSDFVIRLSNHIGSISQTHLAHPDEPFPHIVRHFQRFLDKDLLERIKVKLTSVYQSDET